MQHVYFPLPKYEEGKKKPKICVFPSFFEAKTGAPNTSSTNKMHLLQMSKKNNLQKKELPRIHPARMATGGAVTHSGWQQRGAVMVAPTVHRQWCLEHKQQCPRPAWWQRCFLRPLMWYDFELCSWQCGLQAYFPNLRKLRARPYPFNELARDDSYCLQLRTLMNAASILKGLRKMTQTKHSGSSKRE